MSLTLANFASLSVFHFLLVFCRIGSVAMIMPGIGEFFVSPMVRLLLALLISALLLPVLDGAMPPLPESGLMLSLMVISEVLIGIMFGVMVRAMQAIMHMAGMTMAFVSSLAAAQLFDATQGSQGSVFGNFLTIMAITIFLAMDLHHVVLQGVVGSYDLFVPGALFFPTAQAVATYTELTSDVFVIGFKIAAPLVIIGLALYIAAGIMGRLMPQMQVFFILVPVQILVSFYTLMITLGMVMMTYIHHMEDRIADIFQM